MKRFPRKLFKMSLDLEHIDATPDKDCKICKGLGWFETVAISAYYEEWTKIDCSCKTSAVVKST